MPLESWTPSSTFQLKERLLGTVTPAALKHSSYVSQLTSGSRAPQKSTGYERQVLAEVEKFYLAGTSDAGVRQQEANAWIAAWAVEHRADDALFEAFIRHGPQAECQSGWDKRAARLFAELALAKGDRPTFVDMQIYLISTGYERVGWSSWAHEGRRPE